MIITTLWLEQRESLTIHVLRKRWREKKRHEVRLGPTDAVEQREEGWNLWRGTRVCPFGCRLPQQQSTFRLADPSFPVTRMAFPLFDVSTPAGTRLRRREERKKNVRESGEASKGRHCSTMAQLFFVVERGGRKKKKESFASSLLELFAAQMEPRDIEIRDRCFYGITRFTNIAGRNGI